ncbi:hypothetical protein EBX93_06695 [bacterium]|nr:hypothetical protein [bacterium]
MGTPNKIIDLNRTWREENQSDQNPAPKFSTIHGNLPTDDGISLFEETCFLNQLIFSKPSIYPR